MKKRREFYTSHPEVQQQESDPQQKEHIQAERELYADHNISVVLEFSPKWVCYDILSLYPLLAVHGKFMVFLTV